MTNATLTAPTVRPLAGAEKPAAAPTEATLTLAAAQQACRRIAPLWPLKHFVAVNPFLGVVDQRFAEALSGSLRERSLSATAAFSPIIIRPLATRGQSQGGCGTKELRQI